MKKILVSGGAGFIGSHLCFSLLQQGHEIICLDNFVTGNQSNIQHLKDHPRFKLVCHDVQERLFIPVDQIYNLACPASPKQYQIDPINTIQTCVLGSINMLSLAKQCGATVLQASTSEIYGDPLVSPQNEKYRGNVNILGPRSCYDEGKRCAESLFMNYFKNYSVDIRIARIFNTYGPHLAPDDGRVVSNFIIHALTDSNLTIYGNGDQTRSFCYVEDTVRALIRLMESNETGPVNIGNPYEHSIKDLAQMIISLTGSASQVIYQESQEDDPQRRCPDISRARDILGWSPTVDLTCGLKRTIKYFQEKNLCASLL